MHWSRDYPSIPKVSQANVWMPQVGNFEHMCGFSKIDKTLYSYLMHILGWKQCCEQHWTLVIEIAKKITEQAAKITPIKVFQLYLLQTADMDFYSDSVMSNGLYKVTSLRWLCMKHPHRYTTSTCLQGA